MRGSTVGAEWEVRSRGLGPGAAMGHVPDVLLFLSLSFLMCGMGVGPAVSHWGVVSPKRTDGSAGPPVSQGGIREQDERYSRL